MSETPHDIEHDARLTALYRASQAEAEPPAQLNDAIRAAARRGVGSRPVDSARLSSRQPWRVPLSIAAVLVLSVSLVTLMREEAPELTQLPEAGETARFDQDKPAGSETQARPQQSPPPSFSDKTSGLGLRPPQPSAPAIGMRNNAQDMLTTRDSAAPQSAAKLAAPEPFPDTAASDRRRDAPAQANRQAPTSSKERATLSQSIPPIAAAPKTEADAVAQRTERAASADAAATPPSSAVGALSERPPAPAKEQAGSAANPGKAVARYERAASAPSEARRVPLPEARPMAPASPAVAGKAANATREQVLAYAAGPAEPWIMHIEELRRLGRREELMAHLAEFRKRHPDYALPAALRELSPP